MKLKELWEHFFNYPSHLQVRVDGKIKTITDFLKMEQMIDKYADYIVTAWKATDTIDGSYDLIVVIE